MLIHYIYPNPSSKENIPKRQLILACFDRGESMIKSIALLLHKRHLKERGLLKAYKAHNPSIP
jgi:hypothetical protein